MITVCAAWEAVLSSRTCSRTRFECEKNGVGANQLSAVDVVSEDEALVASHENRVQGHDAFIRNRSASAAVEDTFAKMMNSEEKLVDLYIPRKW